MRRRLACVGTAAVFGAFALAGWVACGGTTARATAVDASTDGAGSSPTDAASSDATPDAATADAGAEASPGDGGAPDALPSVEGGCAPGAAALDGGCGDPQTDPHNCGGCGHDCNGGACESGACLPLEPGLLATGQYTPSAIAVDGANVYWLNAGVPVGPGGKVPPTYLGAQLLACSVSGCGNAPTVLASFGPLVFYQAQILPSTLTLDPGSAYWSDGASIRACAKGGCGCMPAVLGASSGMAGVAVGAGSIFFTQYSTGQVQRCPLGGCSGAPTLLASGQIGPTGIALDGQDVYWVDNSDLRACALGGCGGAPTTLWSGQPNSTQANTIGLAADANNLYWTNAQPLGLGDVMQCAKNDCAGTLVTLAAARTEPRGIAVDGTSVYWVEAGGTMRCGIGGCGNAPIALSTAGSPAIAADATYLYVTDPGSGPTDGRIVKVGK